MAENVLEHESDEASSIGFRVGDVFRSSEEFESALKQYKESCFVEFWWRDSRTIEARKRGIDRPLKAELKYYELKYCCIHGGQNFRSKGKVTRNTSYVFYLSTL